MAEVDYFLKIDGVHGESKDAGGHKEEMQVDSWGWNIKSPRDASTKEATGRAHAGDLQFTMKTNTATPVMLTALAKNQEFATAELFCRKAGSQGKPLEFFTIKLSGARMSTYQIGGGQGSILPVDQFSLNFTKVEIVFIPQNEKGMGGSKTVFTWSLTERGPT